MTTLTSDEKYLARILFQKMIYSTKGASFESLFTKIMYYVDTDFRQVKTWGKEGDQKNDGYIEPKGIYYQVYAPEKPDSSYSKVVNKINEDFQGLFQQWQNIEEFYFVFNDEYLGVSPECSKTIDSLKQKYSLKKSGFVLAKDLEDMLFRLADDQIHMVVGGIPNPANISVLDYSIVKEIINQIRQFPLQHSDDNLVVPDWDKKIQFNDLSPATNIRLSNGSFHLGKLEDYLKNQSRFLADEIRNRLREIYLTEKAGLHGDELLWKIIDMMCPEQSCDYRNAAIVVMAKYFETCDIFEEPQE
jgi:hypothetical protein